MKKSKKLLVSAFFRIFELIQRIVETMLVFFAVSIICAFPLKMKLVQTQLRYIVLLTIVSVVLFITLNTLLLKRNARQISSTRRFLYLNLTVCSVAENAALVLAIGPGVDTVNWFMLPNSLFYYLTKYDLELITSSMLFFLIMVINVFVVFLMRFGSEDSE